MSVSVWTIQSKIRNAEVVIPNGIALRRTIGQPHLWDFVTFLIEQRPPHQFVGNIFHKSWTQRPDLPNLQESLRDFCSMWG